jgi:hypothetical protein
MRFHQIEIDYYPGSHGLFLDYLISRFLLNSPSAKTFNPLTSVGSSHNALQNHDYQLRKITIPHHKSAAEFVDEKYKHFYTTENIKKYSKPCLVRIDVDTEYLMFYNRWALVNDHNIDLAAIEIDTVNKLKNIDESIALNFIKHKGDKQTYSVHDLAEYFFWTMDTMPYYPFNRWADTEYESIHVKMDNFFQFDTLVKELRKISMFIDSKFYTDGLEQLWQEFISKNKAYHSWCNVREIIKKIESGEEYEHTPIMPFEQAYIAYYAKNTLKNGKTYYDIQPY